MITLQEHPGRTTLINGKEYLFFSGYSYLGLGTCNTFKAMVLEGINRFGIVYPSSRISNTPLELYLQFESELAVYTNTPAAATFSSGYLSARTAAEVVAATMPVYSLPHTHPASAAVAGVQAVPPATDWPAFFTKQLQRGVTRIALAADTIYPTPGWINNFQFLQHVPRDLQLTLLLDDSHGAGWLGEPGQSIHERLNLPQQVDVLLHFSMSKAFHINAGVIAGSDYWIQKVKLHPNFTGSTPVMPALAYAWLHSKELLATKRLDLLNRVAALKTITAGMASIQHHGTPVFTIDRPGIAPYLLQQGVIISSFGYPHPDDEPINRIVVNALHQQHDLERLHYLIQNF